MCGIAGWLDYTIRPNPNVVEAMCRDLAHRGPDACGVEALGEIVLGHRRLSVIDVDERSNQPLFDLSRRYVITFNGEIYNYRALRQRLERMGSRFTTSSDTEVVLEAYKQWGEAFIGELHGMFAFAIWDTKDKRLLLVRDRLGEKPLFYVENSRGIVFASEPSVFRGRFGISNEPDPVALRHYFSLGYSLGNRSLVPGVKRLPPASMMSVKHGQIEWVKEYWRLSTFFKNKKQYKNVGEAGEELRALIDESVGSMLVSDVPLGAFLSGGIDSSTIVASMTKHLALDQIKAFSCGFTQKSYDESLAARNTSDFLGVHQRTQIIDRKNLLTPIILEAAAREPIADSSFFPMWHLCRFTREHVTVALSGDGGDEAFLGYPTYLADRLQRVFSRMPKAVMALAENFANYLPTSHEKVSFDYKVKQFLRGCKCDFETAHYTWREILSEEVLDLLVSGGPSRSESEDSAREIFYSHFQDVTDCHWLDQASYVDFKTWLPDDILTKVDRASMFHSLEVRAPLLNHRIVEFAAALPVSLKLKGLKSKWLLRRSQTRRLPRAVTAQKKSGFNAPISSWFTTGNFDFDKVFEDTRVEKWINLDELRRIWWAHHNFRQDYGLPLLAIMNFTKWMNAVENR